MGGHPAEPRADVEATLSEELRAIPYEPLLPVENRLIVGSLVVGAALLGLLLWLSATFFPVQPLKARGGPAGPAAGAKSAAPK